MIVNDSPLGNYNDKVASVLKAIEEKKHQVLEVKNYWPDDDSYSGVNVVLMNPCGNYWELQFHTDASYAMTKNTREQYEELRDAKTAKKRKRELFLEMTRRWKSVAIPKDVLLPASLHLKEKILSHSLP